MDDSAFEELPTEVVARLAAGTGIGRADAPASATFGLRHVVGADEASGFVPHANNVAILGWIDRLAERHGAAAGAARAEIALKGRMWFVARHDLEYLGESFVGDEVALVTWVTRLGRTSLERASNVYLTRTQGAPEAHPPRLIVRATSRWAYVDLASRRPTPIPEEVRQRLAGGPAGHASP